MRSNVLIVLGFIAEWFLFTFSMQQAVTEFSEQQDILEEIEETTDHYPDVPVLYWIIPPLKIWLEKRRIEEILRDLTSDSETIEKLYGLSNRALAWTYIALAEIFISADATNELLTLLDIQLSNSLFIVFNIILIGLGALIVAFRTSDFMRSRFIKRHKNRNYLK